MEKLIELLNEYWRQKEWVYWIDYQADMGFTNREKTLFCSKYRWWIEWLVENDKIDLEKLRDLDIADNFNYEYFNKNKSDFLISLLSISDEPIQFLISILK